VISCTQGSLLDKATLGWLDDKQPGRLSIQCVVRPDNDVSRAATKIEEVRELFREAHKTLSARSLSDSNLLGSILGLTHKVRSCAPRFPLARLTADERRLCTLGSI
jgi:DNA polymerase sigma